MSLDITALSAGNKALLAVAIPQIAVAHISSAQLKAMSVTSIEIVPAPGAGFANILLGGCISYNKVGADYTNMDLPCLFYDDVYVYAKFLDSGAVTTAFAAGASARCPFPGTFGSSGAYSPIAFTSADMDNKSIVLADDTVWATGAGTAIITVSYMIVPTV